jgi:hypothetical protein
MLGMGFARSVIPHKKVSIDLYGKCRLSNRYLKILLNAPNLESKIKQPLLVVFLSFSNYQVIFPLW